jgi:hypothetical protein
MSKLKIAVALAILAVFAWWLFHPKPSDELQILDLVAKAEHGVETKNTDGIMDCVARDYRDDSGLSRVDIFRLAMHWQRSSEQVEIAVNQYELDVARPLATGRFEVELAFDQGGGPEPPTRLNLEVDFARQRKGWRKVWLVKSVSGHGLGRDFEGLL